MSVPSPTPRSKRPVSSKVGVRISRVAEATGRLGGATLDVSPDDGVLGQNVLRAARRLVHGNLLATTSARLLAGPRKYTIASRAACWIAWRRDAAWGGLMAAEDAITVAVRVHPGASREAIALLPDGSLDVRLRARPVEGQANDRLIELLAERLGLRRAGRGGGLRRTISAEGGAGSAWRRRRSLAGASVWERNDRTASLDRDRRDHAGPRVHAARRRPLVGVGPARGSAVLVVQPDADDRDDARLVVRRPGESAGPVAVRDRGSGPAAGGAALPAPRASARGDVRARASTWMRATWARGTGRTPCGRSWRTTSGRPASTRCT